MLRCWWMEKKVVFEAVRMRSLKLWLFENLPEYLISMGTCLPEGVSARMSMAVDMLRVRFATGT